MPAGLTVAVAGRLPEGLSAPPNVALLGRIPDAAQFLESCRVVALTSRAGTGVQLKTIETLSLGLPAVATPLSMRGLTDHPANIMLALEPAAFAQRLAEHVEAVRDGRVSRMDGAAFLAAQRKALRRALDQGLTYPERDQPNVRVPTVELSPS